MAQTIKRTFTVEYEDIDLDGHFRKQPQTYVLWFAAIPGVGVFILITYYVLRGNAVRNDPASCSTERFTMASERPLFWQDLKDQIFVCDCGFDSSEPDEWQDHAETCLQTPDPYEICWCKHQQRAHYTPDGSCGSAFGCDCKRFVKNDEQRDGR